jgi:hypothetical protein
LARGGAPDLVPQLLELVSERQQLADAAPGTLMIRRGLRPGLLAPPTLGTRFAWSAAG